VQFVEVFEVGVVLLTAPLSIGERNEIQNVAGRDGQLVVQTVPEVGHKLGGHGDELGSHRLIEAAECVLVVSYSAVGCGAPLAASDAGRVLT
jgi:hypothetical protein